MRPPQKMSPTKLTLKSMSILSITLRIKAYGTHTKRTLTILRYKHLRTLIGLQSKDLNNCSDVMEYGSLIKRASQYHRHCMMSLTKITVQNGQIKKLNYSLTMKDPLIYMPSTTVLNHVHQLP